MPSTEPIRDAAPDPVVDERDRDRNVLNLVLDDPWPWSVGEIARELRSDLDARDAVTRLADAGLLHRLDGGFVFPTRAARRADELSVGDA